MTNDYISAGPGENKPIFDLPAGMSTLHSPHPP